MSKQIILQLIVIVAGLAALLAIVGLVSEALAPTPAGADHKITICHTTGSKTVEIEIIAQAWNAHQAHGDTIFDVARDSCLPLPNDVALGSDPNLPAVSLAHGSHKITICHRTHSESNPTVEITIAAQGWNGHERHGDTLGSCPVSSSSEDGSHRTLTPVASSIVSGPVEAPVQPIAFPDSGGAP